LIMDAVEARRTVAADERRQRFPGIEGLRALAALSILIVHTWADGSRAGRADFGRILNQHFSDLSYGVTLFFSLSGFLLYRPFAAALLRGAPRPGFFPYLRNRALRILPAYWVILLLCALLVGGLLSRENGQLESGTLPEAGLLARAALLVQNYNPRTFLIGIGPAWSLAVEAVFYLALPLLVLLAFWLSRRTSRRVGAALAPAVVLLLVGLVGKLISAHVVPAASASAGWNPDWHSVIDKSFLGQADLFSFGMALAVLHTLWVDGRVSLPRHWQSACLGIASAGYLVSSQASWQEVQLSYSPYNTLMALSCALVVALVVFSSPKESRLIRVLNSSPLLWAGIVSYSVFLWHHPLILSLRDHGLTFDGRLGFLLNLGITLLVTGVLSSLTYRFVEAPALALKRGSPRTVIVTPPHPRPDSSGGQRVPRLGPD
jgi:peptidoglycan/LPS O-acetylase OafA/YrhL